MDRRWIIGVGALGVLFVGAGLLLSSSDEDEIRALLDRLTRAVAPPSSAATNPALRALELRSELKAIFAVGAKVDARELGESGPLGIDEVVGASMRYGESYLGATITLSQIRVDLPKKSTSASATATAVLSGGPGDPSRRDTRDVRFELGKIDGEWRILSVSVGAKR